MFNLCTGYYLNYYRHTNDQIFIIINEANGITEDRASMEKIYRAEAICEDYINGDHIADGDICRILENKLESIFKYGVQVYIVKKSGQFERI